MEEPNIFDDLKRTIGGTLERELRGFGPPGLDTEAQPIFNHRFPTAVVSLNSLFRLLLVSIGATQDPSYERFGWHFHFTVGDQRCSLRWTKTGVRLYLHGPATDPGAAEDIAIKIEQRLVRAAKQVYRRIITPRLKTLMNNGPVTVVNQYRRYRGMVDFYIREIKQPAEGPEEQLENTERPMSDYMPHAIRAALAPFQIAEERAYRATAVIAAYFSWIQHLLVTLTAYSPRALEQDFSLDTLLTASWAEQFDHAYPTPHDASAAQLKSDLSGLAKEFRNPLLHGGGGRYDDGVVVQWAPGEQIMALDPDAVTDLYMLWQPALSAEQVDDMLSRIERIDNALQAHPFFELVASGNPANFDRDQVRRFLRALEKGTVNEYIAMHSGAHDDMINWDY
ncbi:hypothetical protein J2T11_000054 [Paenarthrobacter nicotinovorans]|uniref:hypothetical protein n=1 Tax=Paenarthrobacter nicotinovorans TaxID=29320 RepID=UPI00277ECB08|nr:hypothetical protein [Paenarthrobacter nicotinovorans]MDP9933730.1 hypothetical protein [Paenarthrobacter nicotinovorans]